jgi:predicted PurR-regulated permease PerM
LLWSSAERIGQRFDCPGGWRKLARLETGFDLTGELACFALLPDTEHGVDGRDDASFDPELDVDGFQLATWDVGIGGNPDLDQHLVACGQGRRLAHRFRAEAHGSGITVSPRALNVRQRSHAGGAMAERWIRFRARNVLAVLGIAIAVFALLKVVIIARQVLSWILISIFLTMALNPAVDWLQRRGVSRRGLAAAVTYVGAIGAIVGIGFLFIPTLIEQVNDFARAVPGYLEDLTKGRGRLGFLQEKYHLVDKARDALEKGGAAKLFGFSGAALAITKSIITIVVATLTITFMTFFMLLEGPLWMDRLYSLLPERLQPRWRAVGRDIYRTVGGYVTGNLLISLIAGTLTTLVLLVMDVPYAVALGLLVAILDLIPLAGATIAAILIGTVAFIHTIPAGIVVVVFFLIYQQVENHLLQPLIYGRTVQLSPLAVLIAVLIGAELAGVLGALAAIPVAGAIQVLIRDWLRHSREQIVEPAAGVVSPTSGEP